MRNTAKLALAAGMTLLTVPSGLAQTACPLTYQVFEFAIPHLDLETCPRSLAREGVFCRATTGNDSVHVFVFSQAGDKCLLATRSFGAGEYGLTVR